MDNQCTVLPDGSAFATVSWPLPKDHWLYAPRGEWDNARDEHAECPLPILTNAQRHAVTAAARYAIRGATMCGQEQDFDPDALVQNLCYALCGPFDCRVIRRETTEKEMAEELTKGERKQIAEILDRRANEIAGFSGDYRKDGNHLGSVALALSREIERLRRLADLVNPPEAEDDDA